LTIFALSKINYLQIPICSQIKAFGGAIDRFFMQVRRRLSLLERPISSSANLGRRWFGYGPYKPVMVGKLLDIFRVFYNFVEVGKNKQTPAMRLGLAKGKITIENIIYYQLSVKNLLRILQRVQHMPVAEDFF
jgi:hypothetical protein